MTVVDASVWVSGFLPEDEHHAASRHWLDQRVGASDALVIPTLALPEIDGAIARRTMSEELGRLASDVLVSTPNLRRIPLTHELSLEATQLAAGLRLRGADAVYVAVARLYALPLLTWDLEVRTKAASIISVEQP